MTSTTTRSYTAYNFLRWVMAGLVAANHGRDMLFLNSTEVPNLSLPWRAIYFLTGFGHTAVVVFFVLSGFFVGGKLLEPGGLEPERLRQYYLDRFCRIYIVLVPALLLTAMLDNVGATFAPIYETTGWSSSWAMPLSHSNTVINFLASLTNLTMVFGGTFGSDGPLWSLAYEWLIYLLAPLLFLGSGILAPRNLSPAFFARVAVVLALIVFVPGLAGLFGIWLLGMVARWSQDRGILGKGNLAWTAAVAGLFLGVMVLDRFNRIGLWGDEVLGLSCAVLCALPALQRINFAKRVNDELAGFSYSLYVTHFPIILFCLGLLQSQGKMLTRLQPSLSAGLLYAGVLAVAVGTAYLFSLVTEANTNRVRRIIRSRVALLMGTLGPGRQAS